MPPRAPLQPLFVQSTFSREIPPAWEHPGRPVVGRGASELGMSWRGCVECDPAVLSLPRPPAGSLPLTPPFPHSPPAALAFHPPSSRLRAPQISTQKSASAGDPHWHPFCPLPGLASVTALTAVYQQVSPWVRSSSGPWLCPDAQKVPGIEETLSGQA